MFEICISLFFSIVLIFYRISILALAKALLGFVFLSRAINGLAKEKYAYASNEKRVKNCKTFNTSLLHHLIHTTHRNTYILISLKNIICKKEERLNLIMKS